MTRTEIAAGLLQVNPEKTPDVAREVQRHLRTLAQPEREAFSARIDGVIEWVADYERKEGEMLAGGGR